METLVKNIQVKSVLTKSNLPVADFSVNPYVGCAHGCKYCYASFMKRFTNHPEPWGSFVDVKYWPEIKNPQRYAGKELFIGSVCDPYQPLEETACRTRALLEQMQGSGCTISIATKSDLVLRDLDLIKTFPRARVSWSINTLDENFKNDMDQAVSIERRLAAMKAFHQAGVRTTCFISPIFPGITDVFAIIDRIKDDCNYIWLENLNLRGGFQTQIMRYIEEKYPKLIELYREIYLKKDLRYWQALDASIAEYADRNGFLYVIDEEPFLRNPTNKPILINYFYHSQIRQSAKNKN